MTSRPTTQSARTRVLRFGLVGIANTGIDLAVFAAALGLGAAPLVANVLGWAVAVAFSYVVNSRWTFDREASAGDARPALRFFALGALITLGVSSGVIATLAETIGALPAKVAGLAIAAVLSFFAARWSIENRLLGGR